MLKLTILFLSFFAFEATADLEHKPGQGGQPLAKKLTLSRGCFHEMENLGCGHPREDQGYFVSCLVDKPGQLTPNCQKFFTKLYGTKNTEND